MCPSMRTPWDGYSCFRDLAVHSTLAWQGSRGDEQLVVRLSRLHHKRNRRITGANDELQTSLSLSNDCKTVPGHCAVDSELLAGWCPGGGERWPVSVRRLSGHPQLSGVRRRGNPRVRRRQ